MSILPATRFLTLTHDREMSSFYAERRDTSQPVHATFMVSGRVRSTSKTGGHADAMDVDEETLDTVQATKVILVDEKEVEGEWLQRIGCQQRSNLVHRLQSHFHRGIFMPCLCRVSCPITRQSSVSYLSFIKFIQLTNAGHTSISEVAGRGPRH